MGRKSGVKVEDYFSQGDAHQVVTGLHFKKGRKWGVEVEDYISQEHAHQVVTGLHFKKGKNAVLKGSISSISPADVFCLSFSVLSL